VKTQFTLEELAQHVNEWCSKHRISPANGQAGESLTERNLRYYRSLGLLDSPVVPGGQGYQEKHRLQLVAIRLLQAQGLPLSRIRALLFGRNLGELREIEKRGMKGLKDQTVPISAPTTSESWLVYPLGEDFMLISRQGREVSLEIQSELRELLLESNTGSKRDPHQAQS